MYRRNAKENAVDVRLMDINALMAYLSMGRNSAIRFAKDAAAERRYGRRVLYDRERIDRAVENMTA